jgi:nifR3 family TIM-barrel protein
MFGGPAMNQAPWRSIGGVPLEHPFTLAALSGYSDVGMRVVCRSLGACLTRHEVILDKLVIDGGHGARGGRHLDPGDHPVAIQLMGNDPDTMAGAAAEMVTEGYDLVDINFGCPVKKVLGRCRGGYLLSEPELAVEIVTAVRAAVDVPVMVKMRRGLDDTPLSEDRFWAILEGAVGAGIAAVAVHGRTVEQKYEGFARWEIIGRVKKRYPELIVFGSGDLFTADDCLRMLEETGIDGVTIARGAIENPWIFRECLARWRGEPAPPPPSLAEQGELMDRQYTYCIAQYGAERASRQMRKFGIKRAGLHPEADAIRGEFINLSNPHDWLRIRERYFPMAAASASTVA